MKWRIFYTFSQRIYYYISIGGVVCRCLHEEKFRRVIAQNLPETEYQMQNELKSLQKLIHLSTELAEIKDLDMLMERILHSARDFVNCDAGSIYIKENNHLKFSYTQNDTFQSRLETGQKLIYGTFSVPISNKSISGYAALSGEILNIPDAYHLSDSLPYGFDKSFDESANYRTMSIMTVPLKKTNQQIIGVLQLINAKDPSGEVIPFDTALEQYVLYFANSAAAALERAQLMRSILLHMISMAELRDPTETGNHVNRVGGYSLEIFETWAQNKDIPKDQLDKQRDLLRMSAMLHDVGKVAISDTILKKPSGLTDEEYAVMKTHTWLGARLFPDPFSEWEEASRDVAFNHHEKFDGTGYPGFIDMTTGEPLPGKADSNGNAIPKKGDEIPLFGRIVALGDVYDALSSPRSYKDPWPEEKVLAVIREESGKHFDPELVEAFIKCLPAIRSLGKRYV